MKYGSGSGQQSVTGSTQNEDVNSHWLLKVRLLIIDYLRHVEALFFLIQRMGKVYNRHMVDSGSRV